MAEEAKPKYCSKFHSPQGCMDDCCDIHELPDITDTEKIEQLIKDTKHKIFE